MKQRKLWVALTCSAAAVASAADMGNGIEVSGYSRGGIVSGYNRDNSIKGQISLGGDLQKYRLGNEGDFYNEIFLGKTFDAADGVKYRLGYRPNKAGSDQVKTTEAFSEISGLSFAPEAKFWVGQRRLRIQDIHIVDHFLMNSGEYQGAGFMDLKLWGLNVGAHFLSADTFDQKQLDKANATKLNVDIGGLETNPGGSLRLLTTMVSSSGYGSKGGFGLSAVHNQKDFIVPGLTNSFFLQGSSGLAKITGEFVNLQSGTDGNATKYASMVYGIKANRIVESVNWQSGNFGGQALVGLQRWSFQDSPITADKTTRNDFTLGGRISYAFTNNFKLLTEVGSTSRSFSDNQPKQLLNKVTIAPTLAIAPDFWSRPELRFFVTRANWNTAAASANVGTQGSPGFGTADSMANPYTVSTKRGTTLIGVQYEVWY
jgi:maltoporin